MKKHEDSKTSKLWNMYLEMVELMCSFIKAERIGNFPLYLKSLSAMLPYFAASGHHHYTKSVYCHLQKMQKLSGSHPAVYKNFMDGYNVVRRSDKFRQVLGRI